MPLRGWDVANSAPPLALDVGRHESAPKLLCSAVRVSLQRTCETPGWQSASEAKSQGALPFGGGTARQRGRNGDVGHFGDLGGALQFVGIVMGSVVSQAWFKRSCAHSEKVAVMGLQSKLQCSFRRSVVSAQQQRSVSPFGAGPRKHRAAAGAARYMLLNTGAW